MRVIKVGFFADIRTMVGAKEVMMPCRPTLALLMEDLCAKYGKAFRDFCMDGDKISKRVNILVNGHHMLHLQKDDTPLKDGDDVRIFPLIGGG
ncbi:MAG TPA: molybdopterin synthase sulfur carrier subunit [Synergistaceae bacterium]|jgi:molybdopterin synthase sulfur carrier subunit|uniref:MoaD family protein n=1 Tax=Synergistaceae TaxID=649777 RepID=UPI000ECC0DD9|nr:MoaD family protein [Synergistaceae bacterium DZ-S4]HAH70053.1 molybdopterin synthase sulfur carrier subunit [Synergistaceae bacterium]